MGKIKHAEADESLNDTLNVTANEEGNDETTYEEKLKFVNAISKPMAPKKLNKRILRLVKKAYKNKSLIVGLKDVMRKIRKGQHGMVILAGDVTPIDIMCHVPGVCEDKNIPYVYTPSRSDLGSAMGLHRSSIMVMVKEHEDIKDLYEKCNEEISSLPFPS